MKFKERLSFHPFLFAIYPAIFMFAINIQEVNFKQMILLILVILVFTFVLMLLMGFMFKNKKSASLVLTISIIMFYSYGYLYAFMENSLGLYHLRHRYVYAIYFGLFILAICFFAKTKRKLKDATIIVNVIAGALVALPLISIGYTTLRERHSSASIDINKINNSKGTSVGVENRPDIYYIILDAYTGEDILKEYFDYSNNEFFSWLEEKGFYVVKDARANYPTTTLSLASSLNMKHLECVENSKQCVNPRHGTELIEGNQLMKEFKGKGYRVANFYSLWYIGNADNQCEEFASRMNLELVITVLSKSMVSPFYSRLFEGDQRTHTLCILSGLETIQHSYDEPVFVFAHIMLPHQPYIFGPNGEPVSPGKIELGWEGSEKDNDGYINQLKFANKRMREIVTKILSESKTPPIIIIQGDHGLKTYIHDLSEPYDIEVNRRMSILNAYYLPGKTEALYSNITPVNTFRIILNEYFGSNLELLEDASYWLIPPSENNAYLKDVTHIVRDIPDKHSNSKR